MSEHLSNGQFASKEVTGQSNQPDKETRKIGSGKRGPGRPKGSLNKTTRAVKEFLAALCDDAEVQEAVKARILKGDAVAFFRGLEHVVGRPKETVDMNVTGSLDITSRLAQGRKRVAEAKARGEK